MNRNKIPTILQVLPSLIYGGVERGTLDLAFFLKEKGGHPVVASNGGHLVDLLVKGGVSHVQLPINTQNPLKIWKNIKALKEVIKTYEIDIVHARSRGPAWSAYFAAKALGIPFVTTFHGNYYSHGSWVKRLYNSVMAKGDVVIAVSEAVKTKILKNYPIKKIVRIYRGIDCKAFNPAVISTDQKQTLLKKWQVSPNDKIILMPGRLARMKGHMDLIRALDLIKDREWHAVFVGGFKKGPSSKYQQQVIQEVHQLGLESRITFVETCYDMPIAYSLSHVVVMPSLIPEAFGRTTAEAGAMGKPVVASNHGGATEIILNGKTGWLYPPKNIKKLAEGLEKALDISPSKYLKMGEDARTRITKNFSLETMCQETLKVYLELYLK